MYDFNVRTACYVRVSTPKQAADDKESIPTQLKECHDHIQQEGFEFVKDYVEAGLSGELYEQRLAFQELLADAKAGKFDLVLIARSTRTGRRGEDISATRRKLKDYGVQLRILNMSIQPIINPRQFRGPARRGQSQVFEDAIHGAMAEFEISTLVERGAMGKRGALKHGKYIWTHVPYGYKIEVRQISATGKTERYPVIDPPAYALITELPDLVLKEHLSDAKIANLWNARGITSTKGALWTGSRIGKLRQNPFYAGFQGYGRYISYVEAETGRRKQTKNPDPTERHPHDFPHPWTLETFEAMNRIKAARRQVPPRSFSSRSPLAGVLKCGYCGYAFSFSAPRIQRTKYKNKRYEYRRAAHIQCSLATGSNGDRCLNNGWPAALIWEEVVKTLDEYFALDGERGIELALSDSSGLLRELDTIRRQLGEMPRRLERINLAYQEEVTSLPEYRQQREQWREAKETLEHKVTAIEKELGETESARADNYQTQRQVWRELKPVLVALNADIGDWPEVLTRKVKYDLIHKVFSRITVVKGGDGLPQMEYEFR